MLKKECNIKMIFFALFLPLFVAQVSCSDWVSDWMNPVQAQLREEIKNGPHNSDSKLFDEEPDVRFPLKNSTQEDVEVNKNAEHKSSNELSTEGLKLKLEETLQNAKTLSEMLRVQILELTSRETMLKEAIANGRFGVAVLTVTTMNQPPRSYIIREGHWTRCNGIVQFPISNSGQNLFSDLFKEPRCTGIEVSTKQDPCVFNSVIKYEVVPTHRALVYSEDDYLCLKLAFNKTLERYMSVTKQIVIDTCKEGTIRSIAENMDQCGKRVLSEYSFYPYRSSSAATLPLEYCTEDDGSCKLITAWHVSNTTIENYEFLKDEPNFKKYFLKRLQSAEHLI